MGVGDLSSSLHPACNDLGRVTLPLGNFSKSERESLSGVGVPGQLSIFHL